VADGMCHQILYAELRCQEPLYLGARHPYGHFRSGGAILHGGCLLAAFYKLNGGPLFGGGNNIIVENAPVLAYGGRLEDEVFHLPLTAETCKAFEGASWHDPAYLAKQDKEFPHSNSHFDLYRHNILRFHGK
jgi:hypothetical protein